MQLAPGTEIPPFAIEEVPAGPMKTVAALLQDSNPTHWDAGAVQVLGLGDRVINQGPSNMAYVANMLIAWAGGDPGCVRALRVRFLANVFAGDRVTARGVVTHVGEDRGERQVEVEVWLERGEGERVLEGTATVRLGSSSRPQAP